MRNIIILITYFLLFSHLGFSQGISINEENPRFWSYNGQPIVLLGGSVEDNLFQYRELEPHLDLLQKSGGNYVRCTMSSRDEGNLWPFARNEEGQYDLDKFNEAYWERFANFLQLSAERDIIVQIELWATFDFYREIWDINPFNPKNNVNYDIKRSKLSVEVDSHPIYTENNFFRSVPSQMSLFRVLEYQQKFVDKLLEHSLQYDHVLYCMDNETSVTADWGKFWSDYTKKVAQETHNKKVYTTEMWDPWDLNHVAHRSTMDHPEIYDFVDISQNNHNKGQLHWDNGLKQIERIHRSEHPRPLNNVKVYGAEGNKFGHNNQDAIERFVRNILLGAASTRFHRPPSGLGLNDTAQIVIQNMRKVINSYDHFNAETCSHLLKEREENEAYLRANANKAYALYFTQGGEVKLDLSKMGKEATIQWVNLLEKQWPKPERLTLNANTSITAPDAGNWIAIIKANL
ncbi:hypothetical protein OKW21_002711 [Catalinimonas alkaloidigena]|uniref:hypothetical protein n=1 Tax=Catalinimonas alkaloidigena TaxID=1075417 RepID=UPI002406B51D|nr:hypothetical protein [Catalinimonas alkaloidigena]MDF9797448.1 hypothetical protein [Catalinimonas alkaloidigena]